MGDLTAIGCAGSGAELGALIDPYLPRLRRFAERHLPPHTRGTIAADDLVQDVVANGIRQLHRFEFRGDDSLMAYLMTSLRNRIVDEVRRASRRPAFVSLTTQDCADGAMSPLERVITRENAKLCMKALARLDERDRQLIVLRLARRLPYRDVAAHLDMSHDAARMAVKRAMHRLEKIVIATVARPGPSAR